MVQSNQTWTYEVWDLPTRWFHWINVACIIVLAAIGTAILFGKELGVTDAGKILLKTTHVYAGYIFAVNLLWRVLWGFLGNRHARWQAINPLRASSGVLSYLGDLSKGSARPHIGHNPAARVMITVLYLALLAQATSGLVLAGTDIYYPPIGRWIASWIAAPGVDPSTIAPYNNTGVDPAAWDAMRAFRSNFVSIHYWTFFGLLSLILVHIIGVVVAESREGGGLVSAMISGRKVFDREPNDDDNAPIS
jgi:Ni/Fe-hydrogenase 1 B-type cytochrome subunit